jgi:hypothetical protein
MVVHQIWVRDDKQTRAHFGWRTEHLQDGAGTGVTDDESGVLGHGGKVGDELVHLQSQDEALAACKLKIIRLRRRAVLENDVRVTEFDDVVDKPLGVFVLKEAVAEGDRSEGR